MSKISVIVPVYKVEPYLRRCVDSILNQTFTDFELILVDDGSPDGCPAICDEYKEKDSRVVVIHKENGGLSSARNAGLDWMFANSNSEWLTFIDSDDWVNVKYLEALINGAITVGTIVSVCAFGKTDGENPEVNNEKLDSEVYNPEVFFAGEHNLDSIVAWGKLYKRICFENIRYPLNKQHEDEFTTYKIIFQATEIAFINQPLYAYYNNPRGIMGVGWNPKRMDIFQAFEEREEWLKKSGFVNAYKYSVCQMIYIAMYQYNEAKKCSVEKYKNELKYIKQKAKEWIKKYGRYLPSKTCMIYRIEIFNWNHPHIKKAYAFANNVYSRTKKIIKRR